MKLRPLTEPAAKANNVSRCLTEQLHRLNPFFILFIVILMDMIRNPLVIPK